MSRIVHLFNSSLVSGPENLVVRNLAGQGWPLEIWNLEETRAASKGENALALLCRERGLPYRGFRVASRWDPLTVGALREHVAREEVELLHAHDVKASVFGLAAMRGLGPARPRLVSTHHGIRGRPDLRTKLYERLYRYAVLPRFDLALAVSADDARALAMLGGRLRLHRNGIEGRALDGEARARARSAARRAWGVPADAFVLGFVGRLSAEKGPMKAVEVAAALSKMPEPWRLAIAGAGMEEARLRDFVQASRLAHRVLFLGYRARVNEELPGFDLLLSVSKAEGLPLLVLEAGWAAVPVLSHRVGGIPEVLQDAAPELLADPEIPVAGMARKIEELTHDPSNLERLGEALQAKVAREFSGESWRRSLAAFYSEVGVSVGDDA